MSPIFAPPTDKRTLRKKPNTIVPTPLFRFLSETPYSVRLQTYQPHKVNGPTKLTMILCVS